MYFVVFVWKSQFLFQNIYFLFLFEISSTVWFPISFSVFLKNIRYDTIRSLVRVFLKFERINVSISLKITQNEFFYKFYFYFLNYLVLIVIKIKKLKLAYFDQLDLVWVHFWIHYIHFWSWFWFFIEIYTYINIQH